MQDLEFITVNPSQPATGSVIWLHGLGADGHDFVDIVAQLQLPEAMPLRFIFPHAPVRPVTINANASMRAWYDIYSLGDLDKEDEVGIAQSQAAVNALIEQEKQSGVPSHRILLAGFSPIPYKIFTITAGMMQMLFLPFFLASMIARGARFFLVSTLLTLFGEQIERHLRRWVEWIGWMLVSIALTAYAVIKLKGH